MSNFIDMTGWKMCEHGVKNSHWTILSRAENSKSGKVRWVCQCDCEDKTMDLIDMSYLIVLINMVGLLKKH